MPLTLATLIEAPTVPRHSASLPRGALEDVPCVNDVIWIVTSVAMFAVQDFFLGNVFGEDDNVFNVSYVHVVGGLFLESFVYRCAALVETFVNDL